MLSIRYQRFDQHKQQHQLLIKEFESIRARIEKNSDVDLSDEECAAFSTLFRHWIVDHIVKEDMQLKLALQGK